MQPHLPNPQKNVRSFAEKFDRLVNLKVRYEKFQERNKVLQKSAKEFVTMESLDLVTKELADRDLCMIDSALITNRKKAQGNIESNVLFVNGHAT